MAKQMVWGILGILITGLAFGGWTAHDFMVNRLAMKDEVLLAGGKADFVLDRQMEAIINEISHLERIKNPTAVEMERLRHLRAQLELMRKVRAGK